MNQVLRTAIVVVVAQVLLCSNFAFASGGSGVQVRSIAVKQAPFFETFAAFGQCVDNTSRTYTAQVTSGTVDSVPYAPGSAVKAGDVIMTIDKPAAESVRSKGISAYKAAEQAYQRDLALFQRKINSEDAIEKSKAALEAAKSDMESALRTYNNMVITAPFDGEVGVVVPKVGDIVIMGDYLCSVIGHGVKTVTLELPESVSGKIFAASEVVFKDARGASASGKIMAVTPYVSNAGVMYAKAEIDKENSFLHGSYLNADIIFNKHEALGIPEKTVMKNDQGNFIYKIDQTSNTVHQIYVKLGVRTNEMIEVLSDNLQLGDLIVLDGLTKVHDGTAVTIVE